MTTREILDLVPLFAIIGGFIFAGYLIWRRATGRNKNPSELVGFGGWLWFLAFCQTILPFKIVFALLSDEHRFDLLPTMPPGSALAHVKTALLIALLLFQGFVVVQMYRRRRSFRKLFLYQWIAYPCLSILNILLGRIVLDMSYDNIYMAPPFQEAAASALGWGVWALYVFQSVRVRNTFKN